MTARIILVSGIILTQIGCKESTYKLEPTIKTVSPAAPKAPDTTNQFIYDFMKVVIAEQQLDLNNGLTIEPEPGCDLSDNDKKFLETLLFEKAKPTPNPNDFTVIVELPKYLTRGDIDNMLLQKEKLQHFTWDNTRLGFNLSNRKDWYCFSIPLFSKDRKKAVMMIRDLCPGLCGSGETIVFTNENNKWTSHTTGGWLH